MYKVLLVDDEYMITEGLKKLIPFDHWNMEVVATAEDADQALDYVREHPVDVGDHGCQYAWKDRTSDDCRDEGFDPRCCFYHYVRLSGF